MYDLSSLIAEAIDLKQGDKEFALFSFPTAHSVSWRAEIGNTCRHVSLGEAPAEVSAEGETPEAAVLALIAEIERAK